MFILHGLHYYEETLSSFILSTYFQIVTWTGVANQPFTPQK